MIKVETVEKFNLKEFDKIKNLTRVNLDVKGTLFVGDTFECDEQMAKYLTGDNPLKKAVVKVIEVEPKKKEVIEETLPSEELLEKIEEIPEAVVEELPKSKKNKKNKKK